MTRVDRIAEPWGTRTPYGPGEEWPVRVDQHLADGVAAEEVERWVQSASLLHSNGDGLDIAVKDRRIVGVRGRSVDRVHHGRGDPGDHHGCLHDPLRYGSVAEAAPVGRALADRTGREHRVRHA